MDFYKGKDALKKGIKFEKMEAWKRKCDNRRKGPQMSKRLHHKNFLKLHFYWITLVKTSLLLDYIGYVAIVTTAPREVLRQSVWRTRMSSNRDLRKLFAGQERSKPFWP